MKRRRNEGKKNEKNEKKEITRERERDNIKLNPKEEKIKRTISW